MERDNQVYREWLLYNNYIKQPGRTIFIDILGVFYMVSGRN